MRNIIRRVEKLEQIKSCAEEAHVCHIVFVDRHGKVSSSLILEPGKPDRWTEGPSDAAEDLHGSRHNDENYQQPDSQA